MTSQAEQVLLLGYHWSASIRRVPYQLALYWIWSSRPDIPASDSALDCRPALIMPDTFRVSIPMVWYLRTNSRLTWWWALSAVPPPGVGCGRCDVSLPPAPAARRPARLRPLPATQSAQRVAVSLGVLVLDSVAVHGQWLIPTSTPPADWVLGGGRRYLWLPTGHAGVPASMTAADRDLIRDAFRQRAGHPHAAQVGQSNPAVSIVLDDGEA